jgi:hypothetical protein
MHPDQHSVVEAVNRMRTVAVSVHNSSWTLQASFNSTFDHPVHEQ